MVCVTRTPSKKILENRRSKTSNSAEKEDRRSSGPARQKQADHKARQGKARKDRQRPTKIWVMRLLIIWGGDRRQIGYYVWSVFASRGNTFRQPDGRAFRRSISKPHRQLWLRGQRTDAQQRPPNTSCFMSHAGESWQISPAVGHCSLCTGRERRSSVHPHHADGQWDCGNSRDSPPGQ